MFKTDLWFFHNLEKSCPVYAIESFIYVHNGHISNCSFLNLFWKLIILRPKIASLVPSFFRKPYWSFDSLASLLLFILLFIIHVSNIAVCDIKLKILKFSHRLALGFIGRITNLLHLKSLGIYPVSYILYNSPY